ncbi:unnamed protein product [Sphagnum balticum]
MQTMAGTINNTNAVKWTTESVSACLIKIKAQARNPEAEYLTEVLTDLDISPRAWSYWKKKFEHDDDILDMISLIEGIFEVKLFKAALKGKIPPAVAIFGLKNNHHWTDRPPVMVMPEQFTRTPLTIYMGEDTQVIP